MNILVISYSTIVMELLKLVFKDDNIISEHSKSTDNTQDDSYDIIFIDDSTLNLKDEIKNIKENFNYSKLILIGDSIDEDAVDIIIKKPFLPQDIKEILESIKKELNSKEVRKTNILNFEEIVKIKELMALDLNESSTKLTTIDRLERKEDIKLKGKNAKEFLYECRGLTKKELKKLLKGAKVSIKIDYKRDKV